MKKAVHIISSLLLVIFLTTIFPLSASAVDFPDVSSHWGQDAILYWAEKDIVNGYSDGTFRPDDPITRAEVAKIIVFALELDTDNISTVSFSDVSTDFWAYSYIESCVQHGILTGYTDGTFLPNQFITREEIMMVLYRVTTYESSFAMDTVANAPDGAQVGGWAVNAVGTMLDAGIVIGYTDGTIQPKNNLTRAEFVTMMRRIDQTDGLWNRLLNGNITDTLSWFSQDGSAQVILQTIRNYNYLFLPASADLTALSLSGTDFNLRKTGNLGSTTDSIFDLTSIATPDTSGAYSIVLTLDGDHSVRTTLKIMVSENLDSIFLTSSNPKQEGRDYVEAVKGNSTTGSMTMLSEDGTVLYDGDLTQIKSRGNSTFYYAKKPYQIKLKKKTDLLQNGEKIKTWVLLAGYVDASLLQDKLCKDLAADMNMTGAPSCQWVDLYYDGEYRGTYLLSEKVSISSTGIDITDLEGAYEDINPDYDSSSPVITENSYGNSISYVPGLTDPADISEGYLLELNGDCGDENCWFRTSKGVVFNIKSPENVSLTAATYISELFQEFEDAVYATDESGHYTGINPDTGKSYDEYCDLDSLTQMYLIYLFSNNQDAYLRSTFFYFSNGKFYAGPIWDGDLAFGTGWSSSISPSAGFPWGYLQDKLQQIPSFQDAVQTHYNNYFRSLASAYALDYIYTYGDLLSSSEAMNHILWPDYRCSGDQKVTYPAGTTYASIIAEKSNWMNSRITFMDKLILG